jgi:hypothetical protein
MPGAEVSNLRSGAVVAARAIKAFELIPSSDAATAVAYCGLDAWFEVKRSSFAGLRDCFAGS